MEQLRYSQLSNDKRRTVMLCGNRVYFGNKNDYFVVFGMWIVYSALSILFFITLNKYIIEEVSESLGIFTYFLSIPGIVCAILCFSTDPGVIARGDLQSPENNEDVDSVIQDNQIPIAESTQQSTPAQSDQEVGSQSSSSQTMNQQGGIQMTNIVNMDIEQEKDRIRYQKTLLMARYCRTCKIMRPPLSSHCSSCNHCVKTFDHHCVFMGNCIGHRNQKWFVLFLIFTAIWASYATVFAVLNSISVISDDSTILYDMIERKYLFYPLIASCVLVLLAFFMRCHPSIRGWLFMISAIILGLNVGYSVFENQELRLIDNPVTSVAFIIIYTGVVLFAGPQACFNTALACQGSTQKQDLFYLSQRGHEERGHSIWNFCDLLGRKTIPSEIMQ